MSDKQGYTHKLIVPNAVNLEAARAYIEEVSNRLDGEEYGLQTEGAIAKYSATEAGNKAAEDSIQALGGYGYTKDFPVEKIKRDVKITCIYEGTNEVMEMTIYRGRWQEHLKSRGRYYMDMAEQMDSLQGEDPNVGAKAASLTLKALAAILEECRVNKLTRHQYVTFKLGNLISMAELAACFAKSSAAEKYSESVKFDRETWQAMSRIYARNAALRVAVEGLGLILGDVAGSSISSAMNFEAVQAAQSGLMKDMDLVAAKLKEAFKTR